MPMHLFVQYQELKKSLKVRKLNLNNYHISMKEQMNLFFNQLVHYLS